MVDLESEELKFRVNDEEVIFNFCKSLKLGDDRRILSIIGQLTVT